MHSREHKKRVQLNIAPENDNPNIVVKKVLNEIIANYDGTKTIKKNDVNADQVDKVNETEDIQEDFNLQSILYACCVYVCGLLIFIAIVTAIMAVFYFPYVRETMKNSVGKSWSK